MVTKKRSDQVLFVAGEASGDLHGARLLGELKQRVEGLEAFGLGGGELDAAGLDRIADVGEISVVGIAEAFKILPRAREIFAEVLAEVDRRRPRAAILVDFPEFNLRLARQLKARGVKVFYYISPQVWAWRRGRVKTIAEVVDTMLVLFPFETDFYRKAGVDVVHVGHPLVDEVPIFPHVWDQGPPQDEPYRIALLPGSRASEIESVLPPMLGAIKRLAERLPVYARLIQAPTVPREMLREAIDLSGVPVQITSTDRFEALANSHLALCASGTATLEVAMLGTPMLVVYRLAGWTYLLGKMLVRVPHISLVNLVLERGAVPELLQGRAHPDRIAREALALLSDRDAIERMRNELAEVRPRLGDSGASGRAADVIAERLSRVPVV